MIALDPSDDWIVVIGLAEVPVRDEHGIVMRFDHNTAAALCFQINHPMADWPLDNRAKPMRFPN